MRIFRYLLTFSLSFAFVFAAGCSDPKPDYSEFYKPQPGDEPEEPVNPGLEDNQLRVMSFNVRYSSGDDGANSWDNRKKAVPAMFADQQPTVLTADFNKMLDSPIFDGVKKFMADARTTAPVTDNKASFNNFGGATNYPRIDHIFSSGFTPLRFATVDQRYEKVPYISDHYPIAAVLEFK